MTKEDWIIALVVADAAVLFVLPTMIAWKRRHPALLWIGFVNLFCGWTGIGWIYALVRALGRIQPPPVVRMSDGLSEPRPEDQFAGVVSRLLELPPADRVLSLRTHDGRGIQLVVDSEKPLTLRLDGPWPPSEKAKAGVLMRAAAERPDLARLLDPQDPTRGVVFSSGNQFSVSDLIYRLATEALRTNPGRLAIEKSYEDHDARPEIVATLNGRGAAEILHEESGVRVRVTLDGGYRLEVPTASLDPRRGQRHRARQAIDEARWRLLEAGAGPAPDLEGSTDEAAESWGFSIDGGDAKTAADAALRLLCRIAELPIDVRLKVLPHPRPQP